MTALFSNFHPGVSSNIRTHTHTHIQSYKYTDQYPSITSLQGTLIDVKPVSQFAAVTGPSVCRHDMFISSLAADYDPFLDIH